MRETETMAGEGDRHLRESELAAFLDGGLTEEDRRRVEEHIDVCDACRAELVDVSRAVQGRRTGAHSGAQFPRRWWIPAALAAGIVAAVLVPRIATRPSPAIHESRAIRVIDGEGQRRIEIVSPSDDVSVSPASVVFTWRAISADAYRIFLLSESGETIWTAGTTDTSIALPPGVQLEPGRAYFWSVNALANGIVASSTNHRIQVAHR